MLTYRNLARGFSEWIHVSVGDVKVVRNLTDIRRRFYVLSV